tara:strand:- start:151 stop:261 length:111 start_codon:yes stop_codon:yes gene_type:complete
MKTKKKYTLKDLKINVKSIKVTGLKIWNTEKKKTKK